MTRTRWTIEQDDLLRAEYANRTSAEVATLVGKTVSAIYNRSRELGLKKSKDFLRSQASGRIANGDLRGVMKHFQPGQVAWNKGIKKSTGTSPTRFKPGSTPPNTSEIGSERETKEGYLERKVSETGNKHKDWQFVHHLVWVAANGPVPSRHKIIFKDKNNRNFAVDNLECVSHAELMRRNTRHRLTPEIREIITLRGVLTRHLNQRSKEHEKHPGSA